MPPSTEMRAPSIGRAFASVIRTGRVCSWRTRSGWRGCNVAAYSCPADARGPKPNSCAAGRMASAPFPWCSMVSATNAAAISATAAAAVKIDLSMVSPFPYLEKVEVMGIIVVDHRQDRADDEAEPDDACGQADTHPRNQRVDDAEQTQQQPNRRHLPSSITCEYRTNCSPARRRDHLAKGKFFMHNRKQWRARRSSATLRSLPPWCAKEASRAPPISSSSRRPR